jgi:outer membrane protein OmpA-like peptidoglycan-associated protein
MRIHVPKASTATALTALALLLPASAPALADCLPQSAANSITQLAQAAPPSPDARRPVRQLPGKAPAVKAPSTSGAPVGRTLGEVKPSTNIRPMPRDVRPDRKASNDKKAGSPQASANPAKSAKPAMDTRQKLGDVKPRTNIRPMPADVKPDSPRSSSKAPSSVDAPPSPKSAASPASDARRDRRAVQERDERREGRNGSSDKCSADRSPADLDRLRKQRRVTREDGGRTQIISEPGSRTIVRSGDRMFIEHSERDRFSRFGRANTQRSKDGTVRSVIRRPNGVRIVSVYDNDGRLLERRRVERGGRTIVLIDSGRGSAVPRDRQRGRFLAPLALGALSLAIPRSRYIVDYAEASPDRIYETLSAPPVEKLDRAYTVEEIRRSQPLRSRLRRVDLNSINFATNSWEVPVSERRDLERVAGVLRKLIDKNPREIFLIEGYTDAVGTPEDNLTLSDRRAESIATILTERYNIPPENLLVQGYGEQYLKEKTDGPSAANRRVALRRVTPLLRTSSK